ncbi:MAG: hypothetical protein ABEL76_01765, partial [Bradymonadaceae bacterium]
LLGPLLAASSVSACTVEKLDDEHRVEAAERTDARACRTADPTERKWTAWYRDTLDSESFAHFANCQAWECATVETPGIDHLKAALNLSAEAIEADKAGARDRAQPNLLGTRAVLSYRLGRRAESRDRETSLLDRALRLQTTALARSLKEGRSRFRTGFAGEILRFVEYCRGRPCGSEIFRTPGDGLQLEVSQSGRGVRVTNDRQTAAIIVAINGSAEQGSDAAPANEVLYGCIAAGQQSVTKVEHDWSSSGARWLRTEPVDDCTATGVTAATMPRKVAEYPN